MNSRRASLGNCFAISFSTPFKIFGGGRHEPDALVAGAVLGLRQHVGGGKFRIGRLVGQHEHFARTGQQINRDMADKQPLGGDDVGIARPENLLHTANRLRAAGQRGNRLRAADAVNLRRARRPRREEQRGIDAAIRPHGVQTTISRQPATLASVMVISAVETSGAVPPGM